LLCAVITSLLAGLLRSLDVPWRYALPLAAVLVALSAALATLPFLFSSL
jgi:hypothetical protein